MLEAYLDESGTNRTDPVCVVAGWIGSSKQWSLFEERWHRASKGVVFHGKEFFARDKSGNRVGPYSGWSDADAARYIDALLGVLEQGTITAFGTIVDVKAFMALSVTERHYLTGRAFHRRKDKWVKTGSPNKPYFLGLNESFNDFYDRVKKPGLRVHLVCDQQDEYRDHALNVFMWNKEHVRHLGPVLGEIAFKDKRDVAGLQAADMLAHVCYRRWKIPVGRDRELDSVTVRLGPLTKKRVRKIEERDLRFRLENVPPEVVRGMKWRTK